MRLRIPDNTVNPVLSDHSKRNPKLVFKTDYRLMQVKCIAECSKRAFCITFDLHNDIKIPFVFYTFILSIFEWPLKTGLTIMSYYDLGFKGQVEKYLILSG